MTRINASIGRRVPCGILAVLLVWSAVMQANDPDPLSWILMYGSLGVVCAVATMGYHLPVVTWLAFGVSAAWAATLLPAVFELFTDHPAGDLLTGMSPDRPYVEQARESLGLSIGALGCLYVAWIGRQDTTGAQDVKRS